MPCDKATSDPGSIDVLLDVKHRLNPSRGSSWTSEGPEHRCPQTLLPSFQHLSENTGGILCPSQVQLGKEEETFHWTQCEGPRSPQPASDSPRAQLICSFSAEPNIFKEGTSHMIPPSHQDKSFVRHACLSCIQMRHAIPCPLLLPGI